MDRIDSGMPCFFTQQVFLIGTRDEDGAHRFAPISWVSYTWGEPQCLVISINGTKRTKDNIARTSRLSATVVTPDMLPLIEQFNSATFRQSLRDRLRYSVEKGRALDVPLLSDAAFSYECEVIHTVTLGDTHTYFARIVNINASPKVQALDFLDLREINPVIYSPMHYYTVGEHLGKIGDFSTDAAGR